MLLTDGRRTVWCDLRVGRHVVDLDGHLKYRPVAVGGLAVDPDRAGRNFVIVAPAGESEEQGERGADRH